MKVIQTHPVVDPRQGAAATVALLADAKPRDFIRILRRPLNPPRLPLGAAARLAGRRAQPGAANQPSPLALAVSGAGGIDWRTYAQCLHRADPGPWADILTRTEARVAAHMLVSSAEPKVVSQRIAKLRCSTIRRCLTRIYKKLGVHNFEAAREELRRRI
jgi:hypothetical protein